MFHSRFLRAGVLVVVAGVGLCLSLDRHHQHTRNSRKKGSIVGQQCTTTCIEGNSNNNNNDNNNNNRVIMPCTTPTCLKGSTLLPCVTSSELTFLLPTSPPASQAGQARPGQTDRRTHASAFPSSLFSSSLTSTFATPRHPLPVNSRLLLSSQPGQVGSAQPTTNDVITAVPALPRVVVGPASTAALSSPPGWLSNVVLCPAAAAAAAHTPHQLPTVPISPSTGRRAPGCCQSPAES